MKVLFIKSVLRNEEIELKKEEIKKLPRKIFLAYSIQYLNLAKKIKKQLLLNKITVTGFKQVLGCSKIKVREPILLIGSGKFHSLNLFFQSSQIYIIEKGEIKKISEKEIEKLKNKRKAAFVKYLKANNIGILVSTKPGQEKLDIALNLKKDLEKKGKKVYIFLANNIDVNQLENFSIDSWVNTACPGIFYDADVINYFEIV